MLHRNLTEINMKIQKVLPTSHEKNKQLLMRVTINDFFRSFYHLLITGQFFAILRFFSYILHTLAYLYNCDRETLLVILINLDMCR